MIDTVEISHKLQATGLSQSQAEAIAQSMLEIPDWANLATKTDVDLGIAKLRGELDLLKWMIGVVYALLIAILVKLFLR